MRNASLSHSFSNSSRFMYLTPKHGSLSAFHHSIQTNNMPTVKVEESLRHAQRDGERLLPMREGEPLILVADLADGLCT